MTRYVVISVVGIMIVVFSSAFLSKYFVDGLSWDGKYYINKWILTCLSSCDADPSKLVDEIVINKQDTRRCETIVVNGPAKYTTTEEAIVDCYSRVAYLRRDKQVCEMIMPREQTTVESCKISIDRNNNEEYLRYKTIFNENKLVLDLTKLDERGDFGSYFKSVVDSALPYTGKDKYGYDTQVSIEQKMIYNGTYPIKVMFLPQNFTIDTFITINNPDRIQVRQN